MSYNEHQSAAKNLMARCAVLTLSDTRLNRDDHSGAAIREMLQGAGHAVCHQRIIPDDRDQLADALGAMLADDGVDVILTTGGTGFSPRDITIEVVESLIEKPLPGFGELFRMLSHREIGSGAMLSSATAGIARGKAIFALPGSTPAVRLAIIELILPELGHLLQQLRRDEAR